MQPKLYHSGLSTCAQKVRLALAEKGITFDGVELDLIAGDQHEPEYRRLNPKGVVPTLVNGDDVIVESTIINEYIEDTWPDTPLRPAAPGARARMRRWAQRVDETGHSHGVVLSFCIAFRLNFAGQDERRDAFLAGISDTGRRQHMRDMIDQGVEAPAFPRAVHEFDRVLGDMNEQLASQHWLAGDNYSLADIAWLPYLTRLANLGLAGLWRDKDRLADWYERSCARPSYEVAITRWLPPPVLDMMAAQGERAWPIVEKLRGG